MGFDKSTQVAQGEELLFTFQKLALGTGWREAVCGRMVEAVKVKSTTNPFPPNTPHNLLIIWPTATGLMDKQALTRSHASTPSHPLLILLETGATHEVGWILGDKCFAVNLASVLPVKKYLLELVLRTRRLRQQLQFSASQTQISPRLQSYGLSWNCCLLEEQDAQQHLQISRRLMQRFLKKKRDSWYSCFLVGTLCC